MQPERSALSRIVESVADGSGDLDWDALEAELPNERERRLIRQLRILASISEVHRSGAEEDAPVVVPADRAFSIDATSDPGKVIGRIEPRSTVVEPEPVAAGPAEPPPSSWGALQLLEKVGEGTFGEVYRAFDTQLHREVALKLLRVGRSPARLVDRVLREGRVLARVRHPNVVVVHGAESRDDRVGLWMEYIRGATLERLLKTQGTFSAREAALIGQDLCRAVAAVHGAGLVHRDIKAQNVMREEGGRVVLMDFGAGQYREEVTKGPARLTGTPLYLAPEVLAGGEASVRSDIYSLGVLLYHLVTGDFPVRAASLDDLRVEHAAGRVVHLHDARPDLLDGFVQVVERAISHDPAVRYSSTGEFQTALRDNGIREPPPAPAPEPQPAPVTHRWWMAVSAVLLLGGVGTGVWISGAVSRPPLARPNVAAATIPAVHSMAVLPLESASEPEWFTSGLTDELISTLSRVKPLTVISSRSSAQFKGSRQPAHEIGAALGVDALVVGTIQRDGDQLVLRVQLIHAGTDANLWGESYRFAMANLISLQGQLARTVAERIHLRFAAEEPLRIASRAQIDPRAYDEMLKGRFELARLTKDGTIRARAYFEKAAALSPDLAAAHANLAKADYVLAAYGVLPISESVALATASAERAVELDPTQATALTTLGHLRGIDRDWKGAESYFQRALESNASDTDAHTSYAMTLAAQGLFDPALREARRAQELDPLSVVARLSVAVIFHYAGDHRGALREGTAALALNPDSPVTSFMLGRFHLALGNSAEAVKWLERALTLGGRTPNRVSELARAYAIAGRTREARALLKELLAPGGNEWHVHPEEIAYVEAALGDRDSAFARLLGSCAESPWNIQFAKVDPRVDSLRADARFGKLIRCLNLQP